LEKISAPIVKKIEYGKKSIEEMDQQFADFGQNDLILNYPTVYIVEDKSSHNAYSVYVGETTDIKRRSLEHLKNDVGAGTDNDTASQKFWEKIDKSKTSEMYIIGHDHFNKSLTLDIENKLIHYMSSIDSVKLDNGRTNPQNSYYTEDELNAIFSKIWKKLRNDNKELFPLERVIQDSAIFKASPFHKLTVEQLRAKDEILMKIEEALNRDKSGQLILINGSAGTGKTVLLSSLFFELAKSSQTDDNKILEGSNNYLLVNHDQQLKVYQQIAEKLDLKGDGTVVSKPTKFINDHTEDEKADVVLIDEAHLLWTQGKQSYRGKNQLQDILNRAKVVVAVFDERQILSREQYMDSEDMHKLVLGTQIEGNYIKLHNQMRINANSDTVNWIRNLIDNQVVTNIPRDDKYELKVFDNPENMYEAIKEKSKDVENGISRMLATFDWPYVDAKKPDDSQYWNVTIGDFSMPWNLQLPRIRDRKINYKNLSWAEQQQTIDEVGSTFTIQGFDLNYAAVIIGPSVKYRNGKVVFDRTASQNKKAIQKRTYKGEKIDASEDLLKNELNVLITRGVNGLYVYAVDEQLQDALLKAQKGDIN
jgi:DUF2075 family protein/Cdc6-like AAA superfamily ATPase